ncbi:MAG: T9SS type A sorting domain-containing protein, partial [Bacteroidota bacterium]
DATAFGAFFKVIDVTLTDGIGTTTIRDNVIESINFQTDFIGRNLFHAISLTNHSGTTIIENNRVGNMTALGNGSVVIESSNFGTGDNEFSEARAISVFSTQSGVVEIRNNSIGGFEHKNDSQPDAWAKINTIYVDGSNTSFSVEGNLIGSGLQTNSIAAGSSGITTRPNEMVGIHVGSANQIDIHNNTIQQLTSFGTEASFGLVRDQRLFGIRIESTMGGTIDIYNNTLNNLTTYVQRGYSNSFSFNNLAGAGIFSEGTGTTTIRENTIHTLRATPAVAGASQSLHGILVANGGANSTIVKNKIYNLSQTTTNGQLMGITHMEGVYTIENNMISIDNSNEPSTSYGMFIAPEGANSLNSTVRNNTVLVEGGGSNGGAVLYIDTPNGSSVDLQNNILFNNHSSTNSYVMELNDLSTPGVTSNYNFLYDDGTDQNIAYDNDAGGGSPTAYDRSAWKATSLSPEVNGWILENDEDDINPAASGSGGTFFNRSDNGDLTLQSTQHAMYAFGKGIATSGVTDDFGAANVRSTTSGVPTTIGADEILYPAGQSLTATESGTLSNGMTTTYSIAGQIVARILWDQNGATSLPSTITLNHVTGRRIVDSRWGEQLYSFFRIIPTGGTSNYQATIDYYYHPNELNTGNVSIDPNGMLQLAQTPNGVFSGSSYISGAVLEGVNSPYIMRTANVPYSVLSNDSYYTVTTDPTSLPVELTSFTVKAHENHFTLEWSTASELNNDYFTLYKSLNGYDFKKLTQINGNGTTSTPENYQFQDLVNPSSPIVYYMLEQVDFDGTTENLGILRGEALSISTALSVYPNPVERIGTISLDNNDAGSEIILYDTDGSVAWILNTFDGHIVLPLGLQAGTYILQNGSKKTKLIVK